MNHNTYFLNHNECQFYPSIFHALRCFFSRFKINMQCIDAIKYIYEITFIIDRKWDAFAIEIWHKKTQ